MGVEPARRRSRRGDGEQSFEWLYRRHRDDVYRALPRELGNREDAEDVTQTAFLDAYRALSRGGRPLRPRAWLLRIAENARRRRFRAQRRGPEEAKLAYEPAAREAEVTAGELREAFERLPPNQRATLVLREIGGLSYAEIASRLEVSVPAVQMLLFRARRALRAELEGEGPRLARGLPAWPFPHWLAEGFASPGGSLGVLPRTAGLVAAGAMGTAVVAGTTMIPGARPGAEPPPTRAQPTTVVSGLVRSQPLPARPALAPRPPSSTAAGAARLTPRPVVQRPTPPRQSAPAATPPAAQPPAAVVPPPAPPPPPHPVPVPELEPPVTPLAPPVDEPPLPPAPDPVLPTLPPTPQLPTAPLPETTPVPAPPAGTGEPGGAAIPELRPS
jgi:RNA polymerase sigma factor (sigma-70 family)